MMDQKRPRTDGMVDPHERPAEPKVRPGMTGLIIQLLQNR